MSALFHLRDGAALAPLPNAEALALAAALAAGPPEGLLDAVPGAASLLVLFDPARLPHERVAAELERARGSVRAGPSRTVRLPMLYGGPDLEWLSREIGHPIDRIISMHSRAIHSVSFLGFAPGFAYIGGSPFQVPRLPTPRVRVPAGSVGLADRYTGIYPGDTPGGWRLIGRVAARLFDPAGNPPALLQPGDRVIFEPADHIGETPLPPAAAPRPALLRIVKPGAFTSVQGGPRHGLASWGVVSGGAMDLPALAAANALVGNAAGAPGLEFTIAGPEIEALAPAVVATTERRALAPGERLALGAVRSGARAYLAVVGGLARPPIGEPTRPLRAGDGVARGEPGDGRARDVPAGRPPGQREAVRAIPRTEHFSPAAVEAFFSATFRVSPESDRRGLRLSGPAIAPLRADVPPEGTLFGAVQVPGDGQPIVLGPDRPVTGGYPQIATVITRDLPLLAQARPGATIRFRAATLAEALAER